jgi:23S rRNA (uridine2552-2'-O)-methyltransferase
VSDPPRRRMVRPPSGGIGGGRAAPQRLKAGKTRSASSQAWLERQINDPFAARARALGYRSRAAFKLAEIDDRFSLIRPAARIADLGCAPGGWLQLALQRGARRLVGVDLLPVEPLPGATILVGDFTDEEVQARLIEALGGPPDLIASDMAPNTTGHRATDHLRIVALIEAAADFAAAHLATGGTLLAKAFQGGETAAVLARLKQDFRTVRHVKPAASRTESSEVFLLATGFRG